VFQITEIETREGADIQERSNHREQRFSGSIITGYIFVVVTVVLVKPVIGRDQQQHLCDQG